MNSPLADAFHTTGIIVDDGAALGGVGNIVGNVTLSGGNSQLLLTSAFPGNVGLVASYGTLEGTFNSTDLSVLGPGWWMEYNYLGQNQIAIVPEPAALLLLLAGIFALLPVRSRRKPR